MARDVSAANGDRSGQDSMLYCISREFVAKKVLCATKKLAGRRELVTGLDTLSCARRNWPEKWPLTIWQLKSYIEFKAVFWEDRSVAKWYSPALEGGWKTDCLLTSWTFFEEVGDHGIVYSFSRVSKKISASQFTQTAQPDFCDWAALTQNIIWQRVTRPSTW